MSPRGVRWASAAAVAVVLALLTVLLLAPFYAAHWPATFEKEDYLLRLGAFVRHFGTQGLIPRWIPELAGGHGYPVFLFWAPGALMPPAAVAVLGTSADAAWRTSFVALSLAGAAGWIALGRALTRRWEGGLLAAAAALASPFLVNNLYVGGAFGQATAFLLVPWLLLAAVHAGRSEEASAQWLLAVVWGLFVPVHTVSAMLYAPIVAALVVLGLAARRAPRRHWARAAGALALGLALSAWFWAPALVYLPRVHQEVLWKTRYHSFRENALRNPLWPALTPGWGEIHLGVVLLALSLGGAAAAWRARALRAVAWGATGLAAVLVVLSVRQAAPVWDAAGVVSRYVQYPGRLVGVATSLAAVAACALGAVWPATRLGAAAALVGALAIGWAGTPDTRLVRPLDDWQRRGDLDAAVNRYEFVGYGEFLPRTVPLDDLPPPDGAVATLDGAGEVASARRDGVHLRVEVRARGVEARVVLRQFAFAGWKVRVDGRPARWTAGPRGFLVVPVERGAHIVEADYRPPPASRAAAWVSAAAWLVVAVGVWWGWQQRATCPVP